METYYRIGGHAIAVNFVDEGNDDRLIPSFAPFRLTECSTVADATTESIGWQMAATSMLSTTFRMCFAAGCAATSTFPNAKYHSSARHGYSATTG